jgi:ferritin
MKIDEKMQDALNNQVNSEFFAAYLYLSAAAYLESVNLSGFSMWMKHHAGEELAHAQKIFDYIQSRGGKVTLKAIEAPKTEWGSPKEAVSDAYQHELKVTKMIDDLVGLSRAQKDNASEAFLQWFVTEQVEEEEITLSLLEKLEFVGDNKAALIALDRSLVAAKH